MCTIAETPRKPEHCIAYSMMKLWVDRYPEMKVLIISYTLRLLWVVWLSCLAHSWFRRSLIRITRSIWHRYMHGRWNVRRDSVLKVLRMQWQWYVILFITLHLSTCTVWGSTLSTQGVVKSIIPAIASTNALIASLCVLETVKLVSFASQVRYHIESSPL